MLLIYMVGRALGWVMPFVIGCLCACGESSRSGPSGGNAVAGRGAAGTAGSSSGASALGGTAGSAGQGGAAGSGGTGGSGGKAIDPSESASWTWEECGRIPGDLYRGYRPVAASPDSPFAITTDDGSVHIYPSNFLEEGPTVLHGPVDDPLRGLGYSQNGELLAEARANSVVIWDVTDAAIAYEIAAPETGCRGTRLTFSPTGFYLLRYGNEDGCVLTPSSGQLISRLPGLFSAAFRDDDTIVATGCTENPAEFCVFDRSGTELSRSSLADPIPTSTSTPPSVAPRGDAIVGIASMQAVAWEPDDGSVRWSFPIESEFAPPVFTVEGDRVVVGDSLREVSDGTLDLQAVRVRNAEWLIGLGAMVLTSRPAVFGVMGDSLRVFAANNEYISSLDISGDGTVLATNAYTETFGWRVADDFSSSTAIWSLGAEGTTNTDVSLDGRWTAISGDVRLVVDTATGRLVWRDDTFIPDAVACIGGELRFSPDGRLLVGKRYSTTLDVFDATPIHDGYGDPAPSELLTRFATGGCGQGVAFSADGRELATPEATFSTTDFPPPVEPDTIGVSPSSTRTFIEASPSGGPYLRTTCVFDGGCSSSLDGRALFGLDSTEGGAHPRYSSEGHWIVAAGKLLHLPTDALRTYDENATEALFAPNGDIIAGERDGSLVRFCRRN